MTKFPECSGKIFGFFIQAVTQSVKKHDVCKHPHAMRRISEHRTCCSKCVESKLAAVNQAASVITGVRIIERCNVKFKNTAYNLAYNYQNKLTTMGHYGHYWYGTIKLWLVLLKVLKPFEKVVEAGPIILAELAGHDCETDSDCLNDPFIRKVASRLKTSIHFSARPISIITPKNDWTQAPENAKLENCWSCGGQDRSESQSSENLFQIGVYVRWVADLTGSPPQIGRICKSIWRFRWSFLSNPAQGLLHPFLIIVNAFSFGLYLY